jgi:hypothetical protein
MNYVTLRLLGMGPDEGPMTEIRALIHEMGKSAATTSLPICHLPPGIRPAKCLDS